MTLPTTGSIRTLAITPTHRLLEKNESTKDYTIINHKKWVERRRWMG